MQIISINRGSYVAHIAFNSEHTIITSPSSGAHITDQVLEGKEPFRDKNGIQIVIDHETGECFKSAGNPSESLADFVEARYHAWKKKRA